VERSGNGRAEETRRIAAIDIGSNSIRQIVADVSTNGTIRIVDELKAAPRLGAGLTTSGELSETAMRDALRAMKDFPALEGPISFGSNGDALKPVYIIEMQSGSWKLIGQHPAGS